MHGKVMNLPFGDMPSSPTGSQGYVDMAYKMGHRDARHAAAEIAADGDALIEELAKAMAPFCALLQQHNQAGDDLRPIFAINDARITLGDLRRASAALAKARA